MVARLTSVSLPGIIGERVAPMTKVVRRPAQKSRALEERLQALADVRSVLACQMAELKELRRCVQQAQLPEESGKQSKKRIVRPGRLFMLSQWTIGRGLSGTLFSAR
jgi:hypothetical protein